MAVWDYSYTAITFILPITLPALFDRSFFVFVAIIAVFCPVSVIIAFRISTDPAAIFFFPVVSACSTDIEIFLITSHRFFLLGVVLFFFLAVDTAAEVPDVPRIVEVIRKKFADPVLEFFDNTFFCISG